MGGAGDKGEVSGATKMAQTQIMSTKMAQTEITTTKMPHVKMALLIVVLFVSFFFFFFFFFRFFLTNDKRPKMATYLTHV